MVTEGFDWLHPDYEAIYLERAARLTKLRAEPELLPGVKEHYKTNPTAFISDWGLTFDPRNPERGMPAIVPFLLFKRQVEFVDWVVARWRAREDGLADKSRDMGVSWLCVGIAVWMWSFYPGTVIGFGSRKEEYVDKIGDPKSLFWKIRQFINLMPVEFRPTGYSELKHAPHMRILNPETGSAIVGEAGDNIGRGNRTSIYFKDESAFYEHATAIDAALSQTSNCKIDLSSANGAGNPFYTKRHGGRIKTFTFHWKDDPRKDAAWYEHQKATLDAVIVASEIDIDYEGSRGDAFIPGDLVSAAQLIGPADIGSHGPIQLGVDVARYGDDESVITARRGRVVLWQRGHRKIDTMQLAARVYTEYKSFPIGSVRQIAVDVIGVGSGVADRLRMLIPALAGDTSIVVDVNSALRVDDGINYNLRAQMWDNGLGWLKTQPCSLPVDDELKTQLCSMSYLFKGGLRLIESKDDAKRRGIKSPDRADSLMLTFAYPVVMGVRETYPDVDAFESSDPGMGLLG